MKAISSNSNQINISRDLNLPSTLEVKGFAQWCKELESYRYLVLSALLIIQGCILVPATLFSMFYFNVGITGLGVYLTGFTTLAVLVVNIGIAPMKWIVSTFIVNCLVLLSLILIHLSSAL